jgi:hypothetical protein
MMCLRLKIKGLKQFTVSIAPSLAGLNWPTSPLGDIISDLFDVADKATIDRFNSRMFFR